MSPLNTIFYRSIPTGKDLNGPLLSFIQQPESTITTQTFGSNPTAGIATFVGIATATFPVQDPANPAIGQGSIVYQWYEDTIEVKQADGSVITTLDKPPTKLTDSSVISGSGTTTLTLSELSTPVDDGRRFYLTADYVPGGTTGNSPTDALQSTKARILVNPTISIDVQPVDTQVTPGGFVNISVIASISDSDYLPLTYQWFENGQALNESTTVPIDGDGFAFTGTKTDTLTVTAGSDVQLPGGGSSQPICVSVIDEVSPAEYVIENSWNNFRNSYQQRPFYLLQPSGYTPSRLKIPTSYDNDPLAYAPITVNRDGGRPAEASDWFALMDLSTVDPGTTVSLAVDNSGSTRPEQVRASIELFKERCAEAGLIVDQVPMETETGSQGFFNTNYENWVIAHDRDLPNGPATPIVKKYKCVVSNASASNTPQTSNEVELYVGQAREILQFEAYNSNVLSDYKNITNIFDPDSGNTRFTIDVDTFGSDYDIIQFHSPEKETSIVMRMYGGKGSDIPDPTNTFLRRGGTGGYSEIVFRAKQNTEYTLLGISENSALFLYEKSTLMAVVGKGGSAGILGDGGNGGGVINDGNPGVHETLGTIVDGGVVPDSVGLYGVYGSLYANSNIPLQGGDIVLPGRQGGRTIACTKGLHFINQGISPCADIPGGLQRFTRADGTLMNVGSKIFRGYKAGYNIMETEGNIQPRSLLYGLPMDSLTYLESGLGGRGAIGGDGGYSGAGGGGGSGWLNTGLVTVRASSAGGVDQNPQGRAAVEIFVNAVSNIPYHSAPLIVDSYSSGAIVGNRRGATSGDATGGRNGFRYASYGPADHYMEIRVVNSALPWNGSYGFVGLLDTSHWSVMNWTQSQGTRMMYYLGNDFSFGEQTGTNQTLNVTTPTPNLRLGVPRVGDIMGFVYNCSAGSVNVYHQGYLVCTMTNTKARNEGLFLAVSDWYFNSALECESLATPSQYSQFYTLPPETNLTLTGVTFRVTRNAAFDSRIVFAKVSGDGPNSITFGPNAANLSVQMSPGSVYSLQNIIPSGTLQLHGNTLRFDDSFGDNSFDDLTITPTRGTFTSNSRFEL